jgi:hypothetical protein
MTSTRKLIEREQSAYAAYVTATAAVIARRTDGIEDDETARLRRRAGAYRAQWTAAARHLEDVTEGAAR